MFVTSAVVSQAGPGVDATTRLSGISDGILHCAVIQPARIAPVKASLPGIEQLVKGGDRCLLAYTGPYRIMEVKAVAAKLGKVWEDDTWERKNANNSMMTGDLFIMSDSASLITYTVMFSPKDSHCTQ